MSLSELSADVEGIIFSFLHPVDVYRERFRRDDPHLEKIGANLFRKRFDETLGTLGPILRKFLLERKDQHMLICGGMALRIFTGQKQEMFCVGENRKPQDVDIFRFVPVMEREMARNNQLACDLNELIDIKRQIKRQLREERKIRLAARRPLLHCGDAYDTDEQSDDSDYLDDIKWETKDIHRKQFKDRKRNDLEVHYMHYERPEDEKSSLFEDRTENEWEAKCIEIQLIEVFTGEHKDTVDYINSVFDFDCCKVGFDGTNLFVSPECFRAIDTKKMVFDVGPRTNYIPFRPLKYSDRGFEITLRIGKMSYVMPPMFGKTMKKKEEKRSDGRNSRIHSKNETRFFRTDLFVSLWNELFESKKLVSEILECEESGKVEKPVETLKDFMYTILVNTNRITHDNGWIGDGKDLFRFLGSHLKTFRIIGCKGSRYRDERIPYPFVKIPDKKVLRFFENCSQLFNPLDSDGYHTRLMPYYRSFAMNKIAIYYDCVIRYGLKPIIS